MPAPAQPAIQQAAQHLAAGRPADAADALTALVAGAPVYAAAHVLLAVSLEAAGRPAEALDAWQRAALLVPRSPLIVRERARLMSAVPPSLAADDETDATPAADEAPDNEARLGGAEPDAAAEAPDDLDAFASSWMPFPDEAQTAAEAALDARRDAEPAAEAPSLDARPGEPDDEAPLFETLPLDDLATSLTDMPEASDDDFDPDGFDFSAFDLDDDAAGWLLGTESNAAAPSAPDAWADDALPPDWSETTPDDSIQLMSPEVPHTETTDDEPAAAPPEAEWAVFEDEPEAENTFQDVWASPSAFSMPAEAPQGADSAPPATEAPATEAPATEAPSVADELDSLIASLEDAPRIRPDPAFKGPAVGTTAADVDDMASETLARIYAAQHQYVEAAVVYEKLAARDPARAEAMLEQAAEMRRRKA